MTSTLLASQVSRLIGPLLNAAHRKSAKRIAILDWDSEDASRAVAGLLATESSRQLERKCALVISEGIRARREDRPDYCLVTLPEFEMAGEGAGTKAPPPAEPLSTFPLQFIAAPGLSSLGREFLLGSAKAKLVMGADAHVLLLPRGGVPRGVSEEIEKRTRELELKWLGIVLIGEDDV